MIQVTLVVLARVSALLTRKIESVSEASDAPSLNAIYTMDIIKMMAGLITLLIVLPLGLVSLVGGVAILVAQRSPRGSFLR